MDQDKLTPFQKTMLLAKKRQVTMKDFLTELSGLKQVYIPAVGDVAHNLEPARYNMTNMSYRCHTY